MTTSRIELHTASSPSSTMRDVRDWARIVVATLARGVIATLLGLALWAAAPAVIGWHPTTVMTGSMEPRLHPGDVVVSRPVAETSLHVGQVLLYDDPDMPGALRLHRFEKAGTDGQIVTKGDANPAADSTPIARSAVHGVAFIRVPYVGTPIMWLRDGEWQKTIALALILACIAFLSTVDGSLRRTSAAADETDGDAGLEALQQAAPSLQSASSHHDAPSLQAAPGAAVVVATAATVPTRRQARRRARRARRLRNVGGALAVVILAGGIGAMLPAKAMAAPFAAATSGPVSTLTATKAVLGSTPTCANNADNTVTISWTYAGETVQGFTLLNGTTAVATAVGTARSVKVTGSGTLNFGTTVNLALRTDLTTTWTATTTTTVAVRTTGAFGSYTARCA